MLKGQTTVNKTSNVLPSRSVNLLSGSISGFVSCLVLQPFDLLKTRVQQNNHTASKYVNVIIIIIILTQ
ncbi:hypothetical protein BY996DRAFT_7734947 [Phakopsora pachyrhizi]|nr:hypothetical protein BY996DRAFT_7734947 [Phakopsora pachyrhizi]